MNNEETRNEEYLDNIEIDGLDETYATNMDVEEIEISNVTIIDFIIDGSGSMSSYESTMKDCLEHYKNAICQSKQSDEMIVSKTIFDEKIQTGGYVAPKDFNSDYSTGGCTRLYDAIIERRQRLLEYMEQIKQYGSNARACVIIFSDGWDNDSSCKVSDARKAVEDLIKKEVTVAFIAFGQEAFDIADKIGIKPKNVKKVSNDEHELREVINLASKSAISASKKASAGAGFDDGGFFDV